jgi:hypothetical protein
MKDDIVKALIAHADAHIMKHKMNVEIHLKNPVWVAEHSDHLETIEKELEHIAHYEDMKDVLNKHFGTPQTTLTES